MAVLVGVLSSLCISPTKAWAKGSVELVTVSLQEGYGIEAAFEALEGENLKGNVCLVSYAEESGLLYLEELSSFAEEHGCYLIVGADEYSYDSAYIAYPDGRLETYQALVPTEEGERSGETPYILELKSGKIGILCANDLVNAPELERYYAVFGCTGLVLTCGEYTVDMENARYVMKKRDRMNVYIAATAETTTVTRSTMNLNVTPDSLLLDETSLRPAEYAAFYRTAEASPEPDTAKAPTISVVDYSAVWGSPADNIAKMKEYIEKAHGEGSNLIFFPEMAVTGYCKSSESSTNMYQTAVKNAMDADSAYVRELCELAKDYGMYIVFGSSELIPADLRKRKNTAYNSTFVLCPEGEVYTYRKLHAVEGRWCQDGEEILTVDTPYGRFGFGICWDTYMHPELARVYGAYDCDYYVNLTASNRGEEWESYYRTRLEQIAISNRMVVISCNLAGAQRNKSGATVNSFPGHSLVLGYDALQGAGTTYFEHPYEELDAKAAMVTYTLSQEYLDALRSSRTLNRPVEVYASMYEAMAAKTPLTASYATKHKEYCELILRYRRAFLGDHDGTDQESED